MTEFFCNDTLGWTIGNLPKRRFWKWDSLINKILEEKKKMRFILACCVPPETMGLCKFLIRHEHNISKFYRFFITSGFNKFFERTVFLQLNNYIIRRNIEIKGILKKRNPGHWKSKILWGPMTLWGFRILWGRKTLGRLGTLGGFRTLKGSYTIRGLRILWRPRT